MYATVHDGLLEMSRRRGLVRVEESVVGHPPFQEFDGGIDRSRRSTGQACMCVGRWTT